MSQSHVAPITLSIAGSDSGGGAGIQADLKTFSALSTYGASVITAVTAQNTCEMRSVHLLPPDVIRSQIDTVFDDLNVAAVKTGMLGDLAMVKTVAEGLVRHQPKLLVVDPVMVAKTGNALLLHEAISVLKATLIPQATIFTPNLPEAAVLLNCSEPSSLSQMREAAAELYQLGAQSVLLKGGHLLAHADQSIDLLYDGNQFSEFSARRIETNNTHGTGCTLASAITAYLARGYSTYDAVSLAKQYVSCAIAAADQLDVGGGHGPLNHFYSLWDEEQLDR